MASRRTHRLVQALTVSLGLGLLSLAAAGLANAACQGPPLPAKADPRAAFVLAVFRPGTPLARLTAVSDFREASIVGLWEFEMRLTGDQNGMSDKALLDWGTSIWHEDGTEVTFSGGRPPSSGDVCMGVWREVGGAKFKLHHVALGLTPPVASGTFIGPTAIDELVTVDPSGKYFTGTFSLTVYAGSPDSGTEFDTSSAPVVTFTGVITAHRVTVD